MQVLDLGKPKVFKFKWDDSEYSLNYPRMKDLTNLPTEDMGSSEAIKYSMSFLMNLGLPEDVLDAMDYDVVLKIQEHIVAHSSKKK